MSGTIYKFSGAVVWLAGVSLAGTINEIELPEINWDASEHETIALIGTPQFASKIEAMECTITWAGYSPELAAAAADPFNSVNLQVRANVAEYGASGKVADRLLRIDLSGRFLGNQLGTFSPGEMERETVFMTDFVREVWDGREKLAIGINPPIYRVEGRDVLQRMRSNLGL